MKFINYGTLVPHIGIKHFCFCTIILKIVLLGVIILDLICQPQFYVFEIIYCLSLTHQQTKIRYI
jgi:hypothetical protein